MKNNKGITLVALIITIIVMTIIVGISVTSGGDLLQKSKMTEYIGFMKLVQARAEVELEDELFEDEDGILNSDSITDTNINNIINESYGGYIIRVWNRDEIANQGIDSSILGESEYFVIIYDTTNWETKDIIYSAGCGLNGNRYYTLTDMENVIN